MAMTIISPTQQQLATTDNSPAFRTGLFNTDLHPVRHQPHLPFDWTSRSLDVPSDLLVQVTGVSFPLHRFPLISRCGLLKMLVVEEREGQSASVELDGVPGGAEGFVLAAKFCYGACVEISKHNVVLLRCVAEFLDMSEEHGEDNLVAQTESYLERLGSETFKDIVATLHSCESLLPMAEDLTVVSRCIDWAATKAVLEHDAEWNNHGLSALHDLQHSPSHHFEWWVEDLSILNISFFQRVLATMREKGLSPEGVGGALIFYSQKSLVGLQTKRSFGLGREPTMQGNKDKVFDASILMEREQRISVETIVSLLPREKNVASINFLIGLLRTACMLETTLACRLDLEKRIGAQLHKASLDDLLIPSSENYNGGTLFDVDIVHRLVASFIEHQGEDDSEENMSQIYDDADDLSNSPTQNPILIVCKLLDGYLAEIAPDANLTLSKFIALVELIPEYARPVEDDLYRAIDIYLKAHPSLTDVEMKKVCRLLDFQKLSQEACTHAAQNERLPVQAMVQVLYFEQLRIKNVMAGTHHLPESSATTGVAELTNPPLKHAQNAPVNNNYALHKMSNGALNASLSPKDHYASVRRENRELKLEVARMRMRLSDLEKDHLYMKLDMEKAHPTYRSSSHRHGFFHAFSKSISKLNPFHHHVKLNNLFNHQHSHPGKSHSQPEPHRQPSSLFSSTSSRQASSFENSCKDHLSRRKRHSLS